MLTFAQKTSDATHRLIERLQHEVHESQPKSIVFIAARHGEGTSTIAREYATGLAWETRRSVLIMDACNSAATTLYDVSQGHATLVQALSEHEHGIASCVLGGTQSSVLLADAYEILQKDLLRQSDVIVIDAPSLEQSGLGILLAAKSEATVIVIAAETTPQPVVRNLRERLIGSGANIVGAVLNKRRYYIPQKMYKRL